MDRQSKYSDIRNIPQRSTSHEAVVKSTLVVKKEETPRQQQQQQHSTSGTEYPAVSTSKIDVNAIPIHKGTGKPITQVNIDEDLSENDKPWRQPGTDLSDYFNYGFDEFTWALYAQKQEQLRNDSGANKMMEEMAKMMMGGGMMPGMMPGMPGGNPAAAAVPPTPTAPSGPAGGMPGMDGSGIPPEMQAAFMQQMMQQGMDPSQMDPSAMMAMMQQAGGQGGQGGQGQGQNFQQGYGGQQQGYGYDQQQQQQQMGGRGNFGGRGRGGRRQW